MYGRRRSRRRGRRVYGRKFKRLSRRYRASRGGVRF